MFELAWSDDHLYTLERIQQATNTGGRFACAMPRGNGKTAICEVACIWAPITGRRRFIMLFAASQTTASERLETIKAHLAENELLLEDFPEVVYPIRCLEGISQRAKGQLYRGRSTRIEWKQRKIVLPTVAGSPASGAVIRSAGLDSEFRGANHRAPDGKLIRPDLAIVDDPQTDESAKSPEQCEDRERRIKGGILGLAGPKKRIAVVMPCTVIFPGDLADRLLDRKKNPEWNGHRSRLLEQFPANMDLWEKYWEIRSQSLQADGDGSEATQFYRDNREAMDAGAKPAWPERYNDGEISAVQYAMNLYLSDRYSFASEYQNEPILDENQAEPITREGVIAKQTAHDAGAVPHGCRFLTAHIDVQKKALFWTSIAWEDNFRGHVVAYATWPKQTSTYYTLRDLRHTMARAFPKLSFEAMLYAALEKITGDLVGREWHIDGGGAQRLDRVGIDANWGESTETVYRFCRNSRHAAHLRPMHGRPVGASSRPLVYPGRKRKAGEIVGEQWIIPPPAPIRHISFDANHWKTKAAGMIAAPIGERGALDLYRGDHRLLADHFTSEYPVRTEGRGRKVDEWKLHPGRDNHFWDNLVGNAVLASTLGITSGRTAAPRRQNRRRKRKATAL